MAQFEIQQTTVACIESMDVDLLKTFIEVQHTRHFGRAAENLFITQSAVSARIRQLEDELGVRLFMRDRNNIQLTTAGKKLLHHAEAIIASWNHARLDVAVSEDVGQHVAVAAIPQLWDIFVTDWLARVHRKYADIAMTAESLSTESLTRRILDCSIDAGFLFEPPRLPELTIIPVSSLRLLLVSSHADCDTGQALERGYIYVDWGGDFANRHARLLPGPPTPILRIGVGSAALHLLQTFGGTAYLAETLVAQALEEQRLFRVTDGPVIERQVYAIYRQDTDRSELLERLLALLGRNVKKKIVTGSL